MHVKAQLLDRVGNIRAGEGDVLESPDQATVGSQIVDAGGGGMSEETLAWSKPYNRSCQRAQGYPERTRAGEGRGCLTAALLRHRGSGEEGRGPSS
jgi:hypothetical protein